MSRFELKYILHRKDLKSFVEEISGPFIRDPYAGSSGYQVNSLYYDNSKMRFYFENIDGIPYRRKLRIRHYGKFGEMVKPFVEIKQKEAQAVLKKRIELSREIPLEKFWDRSYKGPFPGGGASNVWRNEVLYMMDHYSLSPKVYTVYRRHAFYNPVENYSRITIDSNLSGIAWNQNLVTEERRVPLMDPELCIVELKGERRLSYWHTELIREFKMQRTKMSKYCTAIRHCYIN